MPLIIQQLSFPAKLFASNNLAKQNFVSAKYSEEIQYINFHDLTEEYGGRHPGEVWGKLGGVCWGRVLGGVERELVW